MMFYQLLAIVTLEIKAIFGTTWFFHDITKHEAFRMESKSKTSWDSAGDFLPYTFLYNKTHSKCRKLHKR